MQPISQHPELHPRAHPDFEDHSPFRVHRVPLSRPLIWLARGWQDLRANPLASLAYGFLVSLMGALILLFNNHPFLIAGSLSGFLLVGPIMTTGLCELSRRRETGAVTDFEHSLQALRHNRPGLSGFAKRLLLIGLAWMLLSAMILQIALGSIGPSMADTVWGDVWRQLSGAQVIAYLLAGGVLSAVVFAISVVSVPMILDLNADADTAIGTSVKVTLRDLPAMLVWATLIVLLVGIGFLTMLAGMVVVFPLLGHATWHAYRDLVH